MISKKIKDKLVNSLDKIKRFLKDKLGKLCSLLETIRKNVSTFMFDIFSDAWIVEEINKFLNGDGYYIGLIVWLLYVTIRKITKKK